MTGVRITVNDREVKDVLRALSRLGREPAAFLGPLGMQIINSTRERARRGVSPQGTPWPLLNPAYAATKRGTHMLRRDGNLLGGLTREVEGRRLRIGTSSVYGAIHQFGGTIRPIRRKHLKFRMGAGFFSMRQVTIPARPWLGLSAEDLVMIREEFEDFAARAVRGGR